MARRLTAPALVAVAALLAVSGGSRADSLQQRYLPGANVLRTVRRFGDVRTVTYSSLGEPARLPRDRRWIARAEPLGPGAPHWARAMYRRSLLVLRALTDRRTGATLAGAREGWAYVWPRDASAAAMALAAAGYRAEARRVVRFLLGLDVSAAARFHPDGAPVSGRGPQGDEAGWIAAAARAVGLPDASPRRPWRGLADYQEGTAGNYLGNAIASTAALLAQSPPHRGRPFNRYANQTSTAVGGEREIVTAFGTPRGLAREAGDPGSGLDSAAAWAVRPFRLRALFPLAQRTLLHLATHATRYGIVPSEGWTGGDDPWTAPTAWSAWSLAALAAAKPKRFRGTALGDRRAALRLMGDLRRASTPAGLLPERVGARTGTPTSTTPLAWSHAFAILALRALWPGKS